MLPLAEPSDRVAESLRNEAVTASDYLFEDDDFDPKKYADRIEASAKALRKALDGVAEAQRYTDKVMLDKREVTEEYDNLFLHGARTFESYCQMVGKKELARRVRPSEKRRGRTEVAPDEVPDSALEAPASGDSANTENA